MHVPLFITSHPDFEKKKVQNDRLRTSKGGVTEIDIAFFRQLMQVNCADIHFALKSQDNNHRFSFHEPFYTRFLAHNFLYYRKNRLTSDKATVT